MLYNKKIDTADVLNDFLASDEGYNQVLEELGVNVYDDKGRFKTLIDIFEDISHIMYD